LTFVIHYRGVFYSLTHLDICYSLSWCINKCQDVWGNKIHHDNE
jgi:hypothetical protein